MIGPTGDVSTDLSLTQFTRATINKAGDGSELGPAMTQEEFRRNLETYAKSRD